MLFPKSNRIKDRKLLAEVRKRPCAACGKPPPSDAHHWKSKGSGGGDTEENLVALCRRDHALYHQVGPSKFFERYPALRKINLVRNS